MNKIVVGTISFLAGSILGGYKVAELCERALKIEEKRAEKNGVNFKTSCKWIQSYQSCKRIGNYLKKKEIKEVAVYGMGELGKCLIKALEDENITVKYVIDRNNYRAFGTYLCYSPLDALPEVQAIIITPVSDYNNIAKQLEEKINASLISLDHMIDEL
ncbi:MAG: hypothetical protein K1W34_15310 [Lachnospiraceae bacterium]